MYEVAFERSRSLVGNEDSIEVSRQVRHEKLAVFLRLFTDAFRFLVARVFLLESQALQLHLLSCQLLVMCLHIIHELIVHNLLALLHNGRRHFIIRRFRPQNLVLGGQSIAQFIILHLFFHSFLFDAYFLL